MASAGVKYVPGGHGLALSTQRPAPCCQPAVPAATRVGSDKQAPHAAHMNSDLFGGGDAVVKYVLEWHDRAASTGPHFKPRCQPTVLAATRM